MPAVPGRTLFAGLQAGRDACATRLGTRVLSFILASFSIAVLYDLLVFCTMFRFQSSPIRLGLRPGPPVKYERCPWISVPEGETS
ncbi:MAG: hypothetical protein D6679_09150 [Candidatus Hydrogenedentota bacterium]|nr:MAG: hypothetical protein D6679_09150 [Candidatus Hydrogenedentota bacterium]